jgi:D-alanine-D-alanine ligase-like ATP-grasp enzyme
MQESDTKVRVGVLRGGTEKDYESSLYKGGNIISHIFENLSDTYKVVDILIDKRGNWHVAGMPIKPTDLVNKIDVAWNTLQHPSFSVVLDSLLIPNIGNGYSLATLENNTDVFRDHIKNIGLNMPKSIVLPLYQKDFDGPRETYAIRKAKEVFEKFSSPWIVKSFTPDSTMGMHLAKTFPELVDAIEDGVVHKKSILIEEFISGKLISIHSVPLFRNEDIYTFPFGNAFGNFSTTEKEKLINLVKKLHQHIEAKYYLKSDFVLTPRGRVYLLNIESTPDLNEGSYFHQVCESVGAKTHHITKHILELALNAKV